MKVTRSLIEKYHQHLCNEEEKQAVEDWLSDNDGQHTPPFPTHINKAGMEMRIWNRLKTDTRKPFLSRSLYGIAAASVLLFIIAGCFIYNVKYGGRENRTTALAAVKVATHTVKIGRGQKGNLVLPDGTKVTLNAASEITYPETFSGNMRRVMLSGEGFFQVTKDQQHPFIVETPQTLITVLGTAFNVKAYGIDKNTSVVVKEGSVRFTAASLENGVVLNAGERGICIAIGDIKKDTIQAENYLGWMQHILSFHNEPMTAVAATLERWYNVPVQVNNSRLGRQCFSGQFQSRPLDEVLNNITYVIGCKYMRNSTGIILY